MKHVTESRAAAPPAPVSPDILQQLLSTAPRKARQSTYTRAWRLFGLGTALVLGAALWLAGSYFTVGWLHTTRADTWVTALGWKGYLIPLAVTAVELGLNPRREKTPLLLLIWLCVLAFDALTTAVGVQSLTQLDSSTLAVPLLGAAGFYGAAIGVALAYLPEKVISITAAQLWQLIHD